MSAFEAAIRNWSVPWTRIRLLLVSTAGKPHSLRQILKAFQPFLSQATVTCKVFVSFLPFSALEEANQPES